MTYCPSQDWDRYQDGLDEADAAEVAFFRNEKKRAEVVQLICAMIVRGEDYNRSSDDITKLVDSAAEIVMHLDNRADPDY